MDENTVKYFNEQISRENDQILRYLVILLFKDGRMGSGTLVSVGHCHGILTAHHVSARAFGNDTSFRLSICDQASTLEVPSSHVQHVVIGDYSKKAEAHRHLGPDLSFMSIADPLLLGTLKAKKSFYPLRNPPQHYFSKHDTVCWIALGSPAKLRRDTTTTKGDSLTSYVPVPARIKYLSRQTRKGFDYIRCEAHSGDYGYPSEYGGMSGGGLWAIPVDFENESPTCSPCVLGGVVYYATAEHSRSRVLVSHGPKSIYERAVQAIAAECQ